MDQEKLLEAPGGEEIVYDDIIQDRGRYRSIGHYSQWGPNRPSHTMEYPLAPKTRERNNTFRKCVCHPFTVVSTFLLVFMALLIFAGAMLMMSYYAQGDFTHNNSMANNVEYGPGDTQNLFFSPLLCQELSADPSTLYSSYFNESILYLLDKSPTLTGENSVTFTDELVLFEQIKQRNLHLNNNSVISLEACIDNSTYKQGVANFYLVKGKQNYTSWSNSDEETSPPYIDYLPVRSYCSNNSRDVLTHTVEEEDQYYLVFVNRNHISPFVAQISVEYNIRRVVWEPDPTTIRSSCTFTTSSCSLRVPLLTSASVLLVYGEPYNWERNWKNSPIVINCAPRIWVYSVLSVAGVLAIALATMCVCCTCCFCCRLVTGRKDESGAALLGQHTGDMYGADNNKEMSDPSGDSNGPKSVNPHPHIVFRSSNNPHRPPSFQSSPGSKFRLGSPTFSTFTK